MKAACRGSFQISMNVHKFTLSFLQIVCYNGITNAVY